MEDALFVISFFKTIMEEQPSSKAKALSFNNAGANFACIRIRKLI